VSPLAPFCARSNWSRLIDELRVAVLDADCHHAHHGSSQARSCETSMVDLQDGSLHKSAKPKHGFTRPLDATAAIADPVKGFFSESGLGKTAKIAAKGADESPSLSQSLRGAAKGQASSSSSSSSFASLGEALTLAVSFVAFEAQTAPTGGLPTKGVKATMGGGSGGCR
jgi:hypothetical protein